MVKIILPVIGWMAWVLVSYLAITFLIGLRGYARAGKPFCFITVTQTFFLWIVFLMFFPAPSLNKLHILWIVPLILSYTFSFYMQGILPVSFFAWVFLQIALIGVKDKSQIIYADHIFSIPLSVTIKTDLVMLLTRLRGLKRRDGKG